MSLLRLILYYSCFSVAVGSNDDDMVEFLNSLGLKGAVGFLELSITGVPLLHVVTAGVYLLIAFYNKMLLFNLLFISRQS